MNKLFSGNPSLLFWLLFFGVLFSRIPFLQAGFGAEEDSWLLAITAKNMATSGIYEMSRAPAHPLQEYIYAWMYNNGLSAFATNFLSALGSAIATAFFSLTLRNLGIKHYFFGAIAFAFTPIVFVSSTYTIDYMLAMGFMMGSFYFLTSDLRGQLFIAGIFLGIAIGFRITSGIILIPFCILLLAQPHAIKKIFVLGITAGAIGLLAYIPVLKTYGLLFFTYSDQFPYPNLPKLLYKATIGVFGTIGMLALVILKINILRKKISAGKKMIPATLPKHIFYASAAAIVLYIFSYLRLPQKSAYLIPLIPFMILLFSYYLTDRVFKVFCVLLTMSSFLFSMNLTDTLRGSSYSPLAIKFSVAGQEIFIDPLTGPLYSDYTKRLNKIAYTEQVFQKVRNEKEKMVLISGWWYNELVVRSWGLPENKQVQLVFYIGRPEMKNYIREGYTLYYLPEQNRYNDEYSGMSYTDSVAKPYM